MSYFDATDVSPHDDAFEPMPIGWYHAAIIGSENHFGKKPKAGEMLKLTIEIDADEHPKFAGRQVFSYLCIHHQEKTPRKIAQRHLSAICHAIDQLAIDGPEDLLGARLMVRLKVRPAKGEYDASNDIASFAARGEEGQTPATSRRGATTDEMEAEGRVKSGPPKKPSWRG